MILALRQGLEPGVIFQLRGLLRSNLLLRERTQAFLVRVLACFKTTLNKSHDSIVDLVEFPIGSFANSADALVEPPQEGWPRPS